MAIKIQGVEVISDAQELTGVKFGTSSITFPSSDGTNGQILATDGNGQLTFVNDTNTNDIDYINAASFNTASGVLTLSGVGNAGATVDLDGRYLTDIVNDTTPTLGGNLDLASFDLTNAVTITGAESATSFVIRASGVTNANGRSLSLRGGVGEGTGNKGGNVIITGGAPTNGATTYGDVTISPSGGVTRIHNLIYPSSDGTAGQVLTTDGSGNLSWSTASSGGISNVVEDTTPQLGGDLDLNSKAFVGNAAFKNTGNTTVLEINDAAAVTEIKSPNYMMNLATSNNSIGLYAGQDQAGGGFIYLATEGTTRLEVANTGAITFNNSYTFPTTVGSNNQVLTVANSASGELSWADASGSGAESDTLQSVTDRGATSNNAITITDTTTSSNTTTGALTVAGGVGVAGNLNVGGDAHISGGELKVTNSPSSTSTIISEDVFAFVDVKGSNQVYAYSNASIATRYWAGGSQVSYVGIAPFSNSDESLTLGTYTNSTGTGDIAFRTPNGRAMLIDHSAQSVNVEWQKLSIGDTANTTATSVIEGSGTIWIDPAPTAGDANGAVIIKGDLQVDGTTTTVNSTEVIIDDLNIVLASGSANNTVANGAGITIDGANAQITYTAPSDQFEINKKTRIDNGIDITDYMYIRYGRINAEDDMQVYGDYYTKLGRVSNGAGGWKDAITIENSQNLTQDLITLDANTTVNGNVVISGNLQTEGLSYHYQSTETFTVTVDTKDATHPQFNNGSTSGYKINGTFAPFLHMVPGMTYRFDQSDASNSGHPIVFYYDEQKTSSYTSGVTNNGTPGSAGAYTEIVISESTPSTLYYQCGAHSLMGWGIQISTHNLTGFDTDDLSEGSINLYYSTTRFNTDFGNKSTTDLSEGTNLYHTTARARGAISGTGDISYNANTGVISFNNNSGYLTSETYSTANQLLTAIKTVDGTTSGLDSDLLDGQEGSHYLDYANFTSTPTSILDFGISDGTAGQVLQTDGSGNFSFTTVSGGGGAQAGYAGYEDYYYNVTSTTSTFGTTANTHDKVQVFKNGVYLDDSQWSFVQSTGIVTLVTAAENGDEIAIWGFNSTTLANHEFITVDSSGNVSTSGTLQIGNHRKEGSLTSTIATTNATNVVMYASADYVGAKLIVTITDGTTGDTQITEALILTVNGGTPKITTYGTMYTSTNALASFDVANVSTNTALEVTMASANSSTVKVAYTLIDA